MLPVEENKREADLIELRKLSKSIKLDIKYATADNFVGRPVYTEARAFLQRPAAEALVRVHKLLKKQHLGIVVYDAYRPWAVTKLFWEVVREDQKMYVADPAKGSKHNRGCAIDIGIYDRKTGKGYRCRPPTMNSTSVLRPNTPAAPMTNGLTATFFRKLMEAEGFTVNENEWWHFDYNGWQEYATYDISFAEAAKKRKKGNSEKVKK